MADDEWLQTTLNEYSTKKYHIEYLGFLSNHLAFGIIALQRLGADRDQITNFIHWYETRLEAPKIFPAELKLLNEEGGIGQETTLGKRKAFYPIFAHFEGLLKEKYDQDVSEFVKHEFPSLVDGLGGSALHGMLQLGYGLHVNNQIIITEGLAYMHHSYAPLTTTKPLDDIGLGSKDILSVLSIIRNDKELKQFLKDKTKGFQERISALLKHKGNAIVSYANTVRFPEFYDPEKLTFEQMLKLSKWLVDCALQVYVRSETVHDFFLLHAVTGSWSLRQVVQYLDVQDGHRALKVMLCILLATYLAQKAPDLNQPLDTELQVQEKDWEDIFARALTKIGELDEHCFKLVQVSHDLWRQEPSLGYLYVTAARIAIQRDPAFVSYEVTGVPRRGKHRQISEFYPD